ncbi:hypothetical protein GA0070609_2892 [Micromonospora echinaurantiaca]|uniref:Uncharacterized protein n=1 Tax=Micromonospora echinaurantiaca TaxID=47857 RepID=A0A1C5I6Y6_9ACTN|nr:hypothetical protein [Micromonospora echinaurantiaca]SCG53987.1 hypothetical protein GA0070609_2892 [Micromonospora echinaurantiaca]
MALRFLARLRPLIVVGGQALAWLLLALDARREWSAIGLVMLVLSLGALAAIPAAFVGSPRFRLATVVTQTIGVGVIALALHDTADKRALWAYAVAALVAVALPSGRPALGRPTVIGLGLAFVLTIGVSAPALAWGGGQPDAVVCVRPGEPAWDMVRDSQRFDPDRVIAGFGHDGPQASCLEVLFDPGATADDAADVVRRYSADPRVMSVSRAR